MFLGGKMKISLKLFATLADELPRIASGSLPRGVSAGTPVEIDVPDQSTLSQLLEHLSIDKKGSLLLFVNGKVRRADYRLSPGDEVGIFPPIGGG